jgi:hypothetical protein
LLPALCSVYIFFERPAKQELNNWHLLARIDQTSVIEGCPMCTPSILWPRIHMGIETSRYRDLNQIHPRIRVAKYVRGCSLRLGG